MTSTPTARAAPQQPWRTTLRGEIATGRPALAFHCAHSIESARSFSQAYGEWAATVGGVPLVGVSGLGDGVGSCEAAQELAAALVTDGAPATFDLWEMAGSTHVPD
jgi:hypothetical protein